MIPTVKVRNVLPQKLKNSFYTSQKQKFITGFKKKKKSLSNTKINKMYFFLIFKI